MANKKIYRKIKKVEMANDSDVYSITFEPIDKDFIADVKGFYEGDFDMACFDYEIPLSKKDCLDLSGEAVVSGYGKHSGKKLWQLPSKIKAKISKMLTGKIVSI